MAKIAFIGLGNMGLPMANCLIQARHELVGIDSDPVIQNTARSTGVEIGETLEIQNFTPDIIITMLPNGSVVQGVVDQIYPQLEKGCLHIDCSTVAVAEARDFHQQAVNRGIVMIDAPVSGGVIGAEQGSLTFMVGGDDHAVQQAVPYFASMGKKHVHCGKSGAGQAAKACNNMLLAISMIGVAEAFTLAESLDLSPEALFAVSSNATGQCWALNSYCPVAGLVDNAPSNHDFRPGFSAHLMLKDLGLAQQAAQQNQVATPLGSQALSLYQEMIDQGAGSKDFSAIIQHLISFRTNP